MTGKSCHLASAVLALTLVVLLSPPPTTAATIQTIEFHQLAFDGDEETLPTGPTTIAEAAVTFEADAQTGYLNILARLPETGGPETWIVRNLLLHDATVGAPVECLATRFPLDEMGAQPDQEITAIEYGFTVTPEPVLDADFAAWSASVPISYASGVSPYLVSIGSRGILTDPSTVPLVDPPMSYYPVFDELGDSTIARIIGCIMGNVDLDSSTTATDVNGCGPAGCANSLDWMRRTDDNIDFPGTLRETYDQLSHLMNRNTPTGAWAEDQIRAKLDFIEAHNLPIEVKFQNRFPRTSGVTSTSGLTAAADSGGPGAWPGADWIKSELHNGEDVEINVSYWYLDGGRWVNKGAHCMVVTGAGRTAGNDWIFVKHDEDQKHANPSKLKQVPTSLVKDANGATWLPGLNGTIKRSDGTKTTLYPRLDSVISESYKSGAASIPTSDSFPGYCHWFARTIPPDGDLVLIFPSSPTDRCYNVTLWALDRDVTPPVVRRLLGWNFNGDMIRCWHNDKSYPVTVWVHDDDHDASGFDVGVHVLPSTTLPADPDNTMLYAGFSLGGNDGRPDEFSVAPLGPVVDINPLDPSFVLSDMPAQLGEDGPTYQLHLFTEVYANPYWDHLGLVIDVLDVLSPGTLMVECPATGVVLPLDVSAPGRYDLDLGFYNGSPQFELFLTAQDGLMITLDSLGVPSLVPPQPTDARDVPSAGSIALRAWPNPFNPSVNIAFRLPAAAGVALSVHDLQGRRIATLLDGRLPAGEHTVRWDGRDANGQAVSSGIYLCRLAVDGRETNRRIVLLR